MVPLAINTLAEVAGEGTNEAARVRAAQELLKVAGIQALSERDELLANPQVNYRIGRCDRRRPRRPGSGVRGLVVDV